MAPSFYSSGDQAIYDQGFSFIPRDIYRFGDPNLGTFTTATPTGINTLLPQNINIGGGGGGGFDPYNTNMSTIRQDYNAFPSRQAGEIYSKTFNPQSTTDLNLIKAQNLYNLSSNALAGGPSTMKLNNMGMSMKDMSPGQLEFLKKANADFIDDARMKYATEGQYVDQYDPNYSSMTEAQKFMDNYPDYYGVPSGVPETGIKGLIKGYLENSLLGKGFGMAKDFLGRVMPINERAIAENEARGAGIFTDDIGRIVTDDYNTAGGIMAGYNLNALTKEGSTALTDRKNTVMNTLENKYGLNKSAVDALRKDPNYKGPAKTLIDRLDLFDEFEDEINTINTKKRLITKMRKDKKAADKKKEEDDAAAAAAAKKAEIQKIQSQLNNTGVTGSNYNQAANIAGGGGGDTATYGGQTAREATYDGNPNTGTSQGYSQHYMDGGIVDMLEIYD